MSWELHSPQVLISHDAGQYIRANGGEVMVRFSPRNGCCGGTVQLPVADLGKPVHGGGYKKVRKNGIVVHIQNEVARAASESIQISVDGFLRWHRLYVEGVAMRP